MVARPTDLIYELSGTAAVKIDYDRIAPLLDYVAQLELELTSEKAEVDDVSTELYRKIDTLSANNALLNKTINKLVRRLEMINGITKTLASTVEALSDSN